MKQLIILPETWNLGSRRRYGEDLKFWKEAEIFLWSTLESSWTGGGGGGSMDLQAHKCGPLPYYEARIRAESDIDTYETWQIWKVTLHEADVIVESTVRNVWKKKNGIVKICTVQYQIFEKWNCTVPKKYCATIRG